jgi:ADP-heptose:LPS heptosyltransferase
MEKSTVKPKKTLILWYEYIWHADTVIEKLCWKYPNSIFFVLAQAEAMCAIVKNPHVAEVSEYKAPLNLKYGLRLLTFFREEKFDCLVILIPTFQEMRRRREQLLAVMSKVPRKELFGVAECSIKKVTMLPTLFYIISEFLAVIIRKILSLFSLGLVSLITVKDKRRVKELLLSNHIKKILILNYLPTLGNAIAIIPLINAIKKRFSWVQIFLLVSSKTKEMFEDDKAVKGIISYDFNNRRQGIIEKLPKQGLKSKLRLLKQLKKEDFDLCIDIEPCEESLVFTSLAGIRFRIGSLNYKQYVKCFTANILHPWIESHNDSNWIEYVLGLTKFLDINASKIDRQITIKTDDDSIKWVDDFFFNNDIGNSDTVICIHPGTGTGWLNKQWGVEKFGNLIQLLVARHNVKPIIIGTSDEKELVCKIAEFSQATPILAVGKTNIKQLAALIKRCNLLICNNSGAMHVASAVGTPTVAICGPSPPIWDPIGERNTIIRNNLCWPPCDSRICKRQDMGCMEAITVEDVLKAVEARILSENL